MATTSRPPRNAFERYARRVYNPLGFTKGYNFVLFFILAGGMTGFALSHFPYYDWNNYYCPPGAPDPTSHSSLIDCYRWKTTPIYKIGFKLHVITCLPAGMLAILQFIPIIRHKFLLFHRINGYLALLLAIATLPGCIMISPYVMTGDFFSQVFVGSASVLIFVSLCLAVYNIKRLQIDQHRAWMIRSWLYLGFIVSQRLIQFMMMGILSVWQHRELFQYNTCDELIYINSNNATAVYEQWPACQPGMEKYLLNGYVLVKSSLYGDAVQKTAMLGVTLWPSSFLAITLHAIAAEIYLSLTPREAERLRVVSYERQVKRGMKRPGNAGLVRERFGDCDLWEPPEPERSISEGSNSTDDVQLTKSKEANGSMPKDSSSG